jgi:hypothetical protein
LRLKALPSPVAEINFKAADQVVKLRRELSI